MTQIQESTIQTAGDMFVPSARSLHLAEPPSGALVGGSAGKGPRDSSEKSYPDVDPGYSYSLSPSCARLPVRLGVGVPIRDFRVRDLLAITVGTVIETQWEHGEDLPLNAGDVQLAWTEFEVVDTRLSVRITRLA